MAMSTMPAISPRASSASSYDTTKTQADSFGWTQADRNTFDGVTVLGGRHTKGSTRLTRSDEYPSSSSSPLLPEALVTHLRNIWSPRNSPIRKELNLPPFGSKGQLPSEAPQAYILRVMEDLATQPSTQQVVDPRRDGVKSLLDEKDEADVLCILLPSSGPALRAVDLIEKTAPQHILKTEHGTHTNDQGADELEYEQSSEDDASPREAEPPPIKNENGLGHTQLESTIPTQGPSPSVQAGGSSAGGYCTRDIVLRMSSNLHDPNMGFVFGRNAKKSDLLLNNDANMRISNAHFRIYLNQHGILMLEDTSTNGTLVDKVLLRSDRGGKRHAGTAPTRSLNQGAMIELPTMTAKNEETYRFIVRFPSRDRQQDQYNQRLLDYLDWLEQIKRQAQVAQQKGGTMAPPPVLRFIPTNIQAQASPNASMIAAATADTNHGLGWNGGEKYNVVKKIGKGAFAEVYQLSSKSKGEVYACKRIEKRRFIKDGILNSKVHNEILVMKDLEHPNIVKYIEYHETKPHIFIMMEYVAHGDLSSYTEAGNAMAEFMCQTMAQQMLDALHYLHSRSITHRDIKPDNILISSSNPHVFKLSDFGLSKMVRDKETFLKSFCGTLLYCAPEIYPGFQRARLGLHPSKRARQSEPRKGTIPYEHSVDTWSIAAVLFHLLCGHAPYAGSMEDEGALMLMNIIKSSPNWEYLHQAGVSPAGIDFVSRALVVDPQQRARELDLLQHPWLTGEDTEPMDYQQAIAGADSPDLDASQLSLHDDGNDEDYEENARLAKKSKIFQEGEDEDPIDLFGGPNRADWYGVSAHQWTDATQAQPLPADSTDAQLQGPYDGHAGSTRLFGEIGSSALRSSGVLGGQTYAALGMQSEPSRDPSVNESFVQPQPEGEEGLSFIPPNLQNNSPVDANGVTTHDALQYPQVLPSQPYAGAAPSVLEGSSLEGTEALVDQMRMDSPRSSVSAQSLDNRPMTPKTPQNYEGPLNPETPVQSANVLKASSNDITPKAPSGRPAGHHGSVQSSNEYGEFSQHAANTSQDDANGSREDYHSFNASHTSQNSENDASHQSNGQRLYPKLPSIPSTASNSQNSEPGDPPVPLPDEEQSMDQVLHPPTDENGNVMPGFPPPLGPLAQSSASNLGKPEHIFAKPLPRYGVLRPTAGSIISKPIRLEQRTTSYGRDPKCTVVFEDSQDSRVSKSALNIAFWYNGIEKDIAKGKNNWHQHPHLRATISTRTNTYIKVNGIHLMKGQDGKEQFGFLYRCDLVEVFCSSDKKDYLQFRCDFFVGQSRRIRSSNDPFKVYSKGIDTGDSSKDGQSVASSKAGSRSGSLAPVSLAGSVASSEATPAAEGQRKDEKEKGKEKAGQQGKTQSKIG